MKKKNLSSRLVLRFLAVLLAGQTLVCYWAFTQHRAAIDENLRKRASIASSMIASAASASAAAGDHTLLAAMAREALKDDAVLAVEVYSKGTVLVRESKGMEDETSRTLETAVTDGERETGKVKVTFRDARLDRTFVFTSLLLQGLVLAVLTFLVYLFFKWEIADPIEAINRALEKVTIGNLTHRIGDGKDDEIGAIAKGVDFLTERLSITARKLKSVTRNVSAAISQLNLTFKNVTRGISNQQGAMESVSRSVGDAAALQEQTMADTEEALALSRDNAAAVLRMRTASGEIMSCLDRLGSDLDNSFGVVTELTRSAQEVASMSENAAATVERAYSSIEDINTSVREVEGVIKESALLSKKTTTIIAEEGMLSVVDAIEGMERIETSVGALSKAIERLGARSRDIEKILSVIKDVTEQTGILSLNAQILALQAGEHGKSFSVVADEMRNLSEKTASSTKRIKTIVSALQQEIQQSIEGTTETVRLVGEGNRVVLKAGDALREILHASQKSTEMAASIERAVTQQARGLERTVHAIEQIQAMLSEVNRTRDEQERNTASLLESISSIKESIESTRLAATEQEEITELITNKLEAVDERISRIADSTTRQGGLNRRIRAAMEEVEETGKETMRSVKEVSLFISSLHNEVEALRKEVELFRTERG